MVDILLSCTFNADSISYSKQFISKHKNQYNIFFNDTLKPKHHFLVNYPTVIEYSSPP